MPPKGLKWRIDGGEHEMNSRLVLTLLKDTTFKVKRQE